MWRPALRHWQRPVEIASTPAQAGVVNALIRARLLVSDTDAAGDTAFRLAHEALLNHWPRRRSTRIVSSWRRASGCRRTPQRWLAEDRNTDLLLPLGKRLAEAEELLLERRNEVEYQTIEYVEASASAQRQAQAVIAARDETLRTQL